MLTKSTRSPACLAKITPLPDARNGRRISRRLLPGRLSVSPSVNMRRASHVARYHVVAAGSSWLCRSENVLRAFTDFNSMGAPKYQVLARVCRIFGSCSGAVGTGGKSSCWDNCEPLRVLALDGCGREAMTWASSARFYWENKNKNFFARKSGCSRGCERVVVFFAGGFATLLSKVIEQFMTETVCDALSFRQRERVADINLDVSMESMPDPAGTRIDDSSDTWHMFGGMRDFSCNARLHAIEHTRQHRFRGLPDDAEDGYRDEQANDRVGEGEAGPHAYRPDDNGKARQPVGACMVAVGNQRCALDFAADADAKNRHHFVAEKTDDTSNAHPEQLRNRLRVNQAVDRLVASDDSTEQDDQHDQDARQILHAAVPVRKGLARLAARQDECDPERNGGCRVPDVVDCVCQ